MFAVRILICALMVMLFFASASHYKEGDSLSVLIEEIHPADRKITLAPGDAKEEGDWRQFVRKKEKPSGLFAEKLQQALKGKNKGS